MKDALLNNSHGKLLQGQHMRQTQLLLFLTWSHNTCNKTVATLHPAFTVATLHPVNNISITVGLFFLKTESANIGINACLEGKPLS